MFSICCVWMLWWINVFMAVSWTPELSQPWISRVIVLSSVTSCADQPVLTAWPGAGTGLQAAAVRRVFAQPLCNHLHHRVWGFTTTTCLLPPLMVSYWPQYTRIMFNIYTYKYCVCVCVYYIILYYICKYINLLDLWFCVELVRAWET